MNPWLHLNMFFMVSTHFEYNINVIHFYDSIIVNCLPPMWWLNQYIITYHKISKQNRNPQNKTFAPCSLPFFVTSSASQFFEHRDHRSTFGGRRACSFGTADHTIHRWLWSDSPVVDSRSPVSDRWWVLPLVWQRFCRPSSRTAHPSSRFHRTSAHLCYLRWGETRIPNNDVMSRHWKACLPHPRNKQIINTHLKATSDLWHQLIVVVALLFHATPP